jgi:hypothetical protein
MIKIKRFAGLTFVSGSSYELDVLQGVAGVELEDGDKIAKVPAFHHVHRNPIRKPIVKLLVDKEEGRK